MAKTGNKNQNYLAQLNARRTASDQAGRRTNALVPGTPEFEQAMGVIRSAQNDLKDVDMDDIKEINSFLEKLDGITAVMDKYVGMQEQGTLERFQANATVLKQYLGEINEIAEEAEFDPIEGYTQDQTYAIYVQVIKEFEDQTRLSRDLLERSVEQVLEEELADDAPSFEGLTKEQTLQVYMQVIAEIEGKTELAKRLTYNAGVE